MLGIAGDDRGAIQWLDVTIRRNIVHAHLHKGPVGRMLLPKPDADSRHASDWRERNQQHSLRASKPSKTLGIDLVGFRFLIQPATIQALALQGSPAGLIGAEAQRRYTARLMPDLDRVIGIALAPGQYRITDKQMARDHSRSKRLIIPGLAAEFLLHDVAGHFQILADTPCLNRPVEFAPRPIRRVNPGQMTRHLISGAFGFAELASGE